MNKGTIKIEVEFDQDGISVSHKSRGIPSFILRDIFEDLFNRHTKEAEEEPEVELEFREDKKMHPVLDGILNAMFDNDITPEQFTELLKKKPKTQA